MTYILNILEGTYVEVATQQPKLVSSSDSQEIDKDDNQTSVKRPEHIVIKTKQVEVVSDEAKDSHFAITQSDKTAEVVTSEGKVIVKNISQDKGKEISLVAGETAMVDTEGVAIHLPASHEEVKQLVKTSEALLIRYERSTQDSTSLPMDNTVIAEESSDS
ncbi:MAG: hypothetical protein Q8O99_07030 [bacterium]|nr:hypothetical protein [bacterium]